MDYRTFHRSHVVPLAHALYRMGAKKGDRVAIAMRK